MPVRARSPFSCLWLSSAAHPIKHTPWLSGYILCVRLSVFLGFDQFWQPPDSRLNEVGIIKSIPWCVELKAVDTEGVSLSTPPTLQRQCSAVWLTFCVISCSVAVCLNFAACVHGNIRTNGLGWKVSWEGDWMTTDAFKNRIGNLWRSLSQLVFFYLVAYASYLYVLVR